MVCPPPPTATPPAAPPVLTLYTGMDCHLCERARALLAPVLAAAGWQLREVCIRGDRELERRYGERIPVVLLADGRDRGWPFTAGQIRRLLCPPR